MHCSHNNIEMLSCILCVVVIITIVSDGYLINSLYSKKCSYVAMKASRSFSDKSKKAMSNKLAYSKDQASLHSVAASVSIGSNSFNINSNFNTLISNDAQNDWTILVIGLKRISLKAPLQEEISIPEQKRILDLFSSHMHSINPSAYVSIIYSLSILYSNKNWLVVYDLQRLIISSISRNIASLSRYDFGLLINSLAKLDIPWNKISNDAADEVESKIIEHIRFMDSKSVGDLIWGLGTIGVSWFNLSYKSKQYIIEAVDNGIDSLSAYSLSSVLWALAKMGVKWDNFSPSLQSTIPIKLVKYHLEMSSQQSSKTLWALGTLGVSCDTIMAVPSVTSGGGNNYNNVIELYLNNVSKIKRSKTGSAIPASQTLTGLAKLGLTWVKSSPAVKEGMWDQLGRVCGSTNDKGIANALWALGTVGAVAEEQPVTIKETMIVALSRVLGECSSWSLCSIIWGLAKMKYAWQDIPMNLRDTIMANIVRIEGEINSIDAGTLFWSLGKMDAPLDALPSFFIDSLLRSFLKATELMKPQDLSRAIWGLSISGLSWDALPIALRWNINVALRRVGEEMSPQDVSNCAYGLAILAFDAVNPDDAAFRGCHEVLLNAVRKSSTSIDVRVKQDMASSPSSSNNNLHEFEQVRIFSQYLHVMSYVSDVKRIPAHMLSVPLSQKNSFPTVAGSNLQDKVLMGLTEAIDSSEMRDRIKVDIEASSFDGVFPVDALIRLNNDVIAVIEVDGPHHYRYDGQLRRKDKLKASMYQHKYPQSTLYRIRWDEANKLGPAVVGAQLADLIISSTKSYKRSIFSDLQKLFEWGMRNE